MIKNISSALGQLRPDYVARYYVQMEKKCERPKKGPKRLLTIHFQRTISLQRRERVSVTDFNLITALRRDLPLSEGQPPSEPWQHGRRPISA
ncbi:hypothetical protein CDAR_277871 [Caerostris darwini]|uniref:Uncharacterized protein n=1 Tax=Caerostris darwini TaxID=1538125 RepID=A0AAV4PI15_9ARAC|nr:hypothetical protein CDAR_277871 [Caerostris darwini]